MKTTFLKGVVLGAVVSAVTVVASAAVAGTGVGGVFNLGKTNTVNAATTLSGSTNGQQLTVTNSSTRPKAGGIAINVPPNVPPLVVNSSAEVANLDADELGGLNSGHYQQVATSDCPNGTAIRSLSGDGFVECTTSAVLPIDAVTPEPGGSQDDHLTPDIDFVTSCDDPGTFVEFVNDGPDAATVNWEYSLGGSSSTVNASGVSIDPGKTVLFSFRGGRIEGQFIFADSADVGTVNVHAFDGGTYCEVRGTAEIATP